MVRIRIRVSLAAAILAVILALAVVLLAVNVRAGRSIADSLGRQFLSTTEAHVVERLDGFFQPVLKSLESARSMGRSGLMDPYDVETSFAVYLPMLRAVPQVTSVATGDEAGHSYRLGGEGDGWLERVTPAGPLGPPRIARYRQFDAAGALVKAYEEETKFEPRTRPWYVGAKQLADATSEADAGTLFWTAPFILNTSQTPGIAAAQAFAGPDGAAYMVTFNLMLTKMSEFTASLRPTPGGRAFVAARDEAGELRVLGFPYDERFDSNEKRAALISALGNRMPSLAELQHDALSRTSELLTSAEAAGEYTSATIEAPDDRWRVALRPYRVSGGLSLWVGVAIPESDVIGPVVQQQRSILLATSAALLGAMLVALLLARVYGRPLHRLARESERITQLDLGPSSPVRTHVLEVHRLAEAQGRMREALDSFSRYIPTEVVRQLLLQGEAARLGGRVRDISVLFTDVRGFTTIGEALGPDRLTAHMATYFAGILQIVRRHRGSVDKMIGDAVMCIWGAPAEDPDHVRHALEAMLELDHWLQDFERRCTEANLPRLETLLGLASGPAFVGNIGAPERLNYTALGDTVNLASRLESATRIYGTRLLVSADVKARAGEGIVFRCVDRVAVKGKTEGVLLYEPLGREGAVDAKMLAFAQTYEEAFFAYQARDFARAVAALDRLGAPGSAQLSVVRLRAIAARYLAEPPPPDWDGIVRLEAK